MFGKFQNMKDDDLVLLYKEHKDDDVELELIERYRIHSRKLAGEFYRKFKFLYLLEYEDIYSIALSSLFVAIKTFTIGGFFKYWKTFTTNELNCYVKNFSVTKSDALLYSQLNAEEVPSGMILKQNTSQGEKISFSDEILDIVNDPKNEFKEVDREIMRLYVLGYRLVDIAIITNHLESFVRYHLKKIKNKISDILYNHRM